MKKSGMRKQGKRVFCLFLLVLLILGLCACGKSAQEEEEAAPVTYTSLSEEGKMVVDYIYGMKSTWETMSLNGSSYICTGVGFTDHDGVPAFRCYYESSPIFYYRYFSYDVERQEFDEMEIVTNYVSVVGDASPSDFLSSVSYNPRWDADAQKDALAQKYASYLEKQNTSD